MGGSVVLGTVVLVSGMLAVKRALLAWALRFPGFVLSDSNSQPVAVCQLL